MCVCGIMKNAYLAICYSCNENCRFCPCSKNEKRQGIITNLIELKNIVDLMDQDGITDITISGGEPTLHPELTELIAYIQGKGMWVTVLSNGERFSNTTFMEKFVKSVRPERLKVITTLHSSVAAEHEDANRTVGSFARTVKGLQSLSQNGIRVIVKHCITRRNYTDLLSFYQFCDSTFDESVDVQLCSIDYVGIPEEELLNERLSFMELKPYLETLFDFHMEQKGRGAVRNLYCINIPLCSCDVYYWSYLPFRRKKMYNQYKDPHSVQTTAGQDNVGLHPELCKECKAADLCSGTYLTAYRVLGENAVNPFR